MQDGRGGSSSGRVESILLNDKANAAVRAWVAEHA